MILYPLSSLQSQSAGSQVLLSNVERFSVLLARSQAGNGSTDPVRISRPNIGELHCSDLYAIPLHSSNALLLSLKKPYKTAYIVQLRKSFFI